MNQSTLSYVASKCNFTGGTDSFTKRLRLNDEGEAGGVVALPVIFNRQNIPYLKLNNTESITEAHRWLLPTVYRLFQFYSLFKVR